MANSTLTYIATRRLRPGITAGDPVVMPLRLTRFERTTHTRENSVETLGGREVHSLYSARDQYEVSTGVIPPELQPALDEFAYSVLGKETFTITHPDEDDRELDVKLVGRVRRTRVSRYPLNQFRYSFTVREANE